MKKIVIASVPVQYHSYFQWLILGLYELQHNKEITFQFRLPFYQYVYFFMLNDYWRREGYRFLSRYRMLKNESYAMTGFSIDAKGNKKRFVFDIADSPFAFDAGYLQSSDIYFKAQCPKNIDAKGFRLSDKVYIPYAVTVLTNQHKIKPAMLGPRRLAWSIKYLALKDAYNQYLSHQTAQKKGRLMCYFGGASGPAVKAVVSSNGNFDGEDIIMSRFANELQHPNEKRYKLFKLIRKMGINCDARVIDKAGVVDDAMYVTKDAPVPLKDFTQHVAMFQYNANVAGFRLSIPNRFIESFMVGTAIVTDQLSVQWYRSFKEEVMELPEMGYLPDELVDWNLIEEKLHALKEINAQKVIDQYNKNWAPQALARYVVAELSGS